jgi:hypothetical protein
VTGGVEDLFVAQGAPGDPRQLVGQGRCQLVAMKPWSCVREPCSEADTIAPELPGLDEENAFSQSRRSDRFVVLCPKPNPNSPTILCDELNSGFFQSSLHRVNGSARNVAARFFKIDNR